MKSLHDQLPVCQYLLLILLVLWAISIPVKSLRIFPSVPSLAQNVLYAILCNTDLSSGKKISEACTEERHLAHQYRRIQAIEDPLDPRIYEGLDWGRKEKLTVLSLSLASHSP